MEIFLFVFWTVVIAVGAIIIFGGLFLASSYGFTWIVDKIEEGRTKHE